MIPKAEPKAEHPVWKSAKYNVDGVFYHNVNLIFPSYNASFQQSETCKEKKKGI